jgi:DNA-binding SARP family transcriptional activator/tetratricopeptide (TPR) repeat protein
MRFEARLLGPWEFLDGTKQVPVPAGRLRVLLTSLLLSANETVNVDTLVDQLWPEHPPMRVRNSLHIQLVRLRKLLGPGLIHTKPGGGYLLEIDPGCVDVHRFRDLLRQGKVATSPQTELRLLHKALELWRGTPFADLYSTWLDREVTPRLTEEWFAATGRRIELELAAGPPEPLIAELRDLIDRYPNRESLWLQLITAMYRAGRRAEALETFQEVRSTLRDELGIEPGTALVTLQQQILLDGTPPPKPAKPAPPLASRTQAVAAPKQLPHDIPRFTGREAELAVLDELLANAASKATPTIVSIDGAPGVGKTTLAVHWARRIAERYPDAQLYLNLRGYGPGDPLTPEAAAEALLRALGVDSERIMDDLDTRSALLRSTLAGRKPLILLDNALDATQVRPLLPGGAGLVIVTSRNQLRGLSIRDNARRVTLNRLVRRQSIQLLAATVGEQLITEEPAASTALVELCDHLPLALAIVSERASRAGSLANVVAELEDEQTRLSSLDTGEGDSHSNLRAALSWSYRALDTPAAALFRKLGLHPANDIDVQSAAALADVPAATAQACLDQLVATHLAEQRRPNRYELHDLIRLYATELSAEDGESDRDAAIHRVLGWYLHAAVSADRQLHATRRRDFLAPYEPVIPPPRFASNAEAAGWFEQEHECLRSAVQWAARNGYPEYAWRIGISMTTYLDHSIPWREGLELLETANAAAKHSGELIGEAYTLNSLGCIYLDMRHWATAKTLFERSFARFLAVSNRLGQAMTMGNMSLAYAELGHGEAAQRYASRAAEMFEELGQTRGLAVNLDNLGVALTVSGKYQQAVESFRRALAINDRDADLDLAGWNWHNLAKAYCHLRDYPNATHAFRQTISIHRARGNRRWEAIVLADFGSMLAEAGHPKIAHAMHQMALVTLNEFADPRAQQIEAATCAS